MFPAEIIFIIINFSILAFFILKFYQAFIPSDCGRVFILSLCFKFLLTVVLALTFNFYFPYETDVQVQFMKAVKVKKFFLEHPELFVDIYFKNSVSEVTFLPFRTNFFIKILSVLQLITQDNNWINHAWFSTISLLSCWYLCVKAKQYYPESFNPAVIVLFFIPIPMIWSCGVLKDSLTFSALMLLLAIYIECIQTGKYLKYFFLSFLPAYLILQLKFYVLGAFVIIYLPVLILSGLNKKRVLNKTVITFSLLILISTLWFIMNEFALKFYSADIPALIFYNYEVFQGSGTANYQFQGLNEHAQSLVPYIFTSLFQGIFMPLPWNSSSFIMFVESVFNLFTVMMTAFTIYIWLYKKSAPGPIALITIVYISLNAVAFGFSTPNWGTLSRYKLYYIPFYHFIMLYILLYSGLGTTFLSRVRRFKLF